MYAVFVENDISDWDDTTGIAYHFPKRYTAIIQPGTKVLYYKGKIQDKAFESSRLSNDPHYFGVATVGKIYEDPNSKKSDKFATILDFHQFINAVPIKSESAYFEKIPVNKTSNYWRDGVRKISREVFEKIVSNATIHESKKEAQKESYNTNDIEQNLESFSEGNKKEKFTTFYERDKTLRKQAILIHGTTCKACKTNFEETYGEQGKDFIHVHHIKPISEYGGSKTVDPETDLTVLCPNCHSMVHRFRKKTLTLKELTDLILKNG